MQQGVGRGVKALTLRALAGGGGTKARLPRPPISPGDPPPLPETLGMSARLSTGSSSPLSGLEGSGAGWLAAFRTASEATTISSTCRSASCPASGGW